MAQPSIKDIKLKLRGYRYADAAARDIHALITNFKSLKPQDTRRFVHPSGAVENLASVYGTIPVKVRGSTYNIPLTFWLRLTHPYHPPIIYVTPTAGMGIQQSRFVDANGMVYLPYLTEWKQGQSDLTALTQILCATFGDNCPVFSKQAAPQPSPWQQYPRPHPPPTAYRPPYPPGYPQQPQRPPYPGQYQPPYPGVPPQMPTPYGGYRPPGTQPYPVPQPQTGQYPGMYSPGQPPPMPTPPTSSYPGSYPPHPSHLQPPTSSIATAAGLTGAAAAISEEQERRHFEEQEKIKRQSLESAVEDKIKRHVKQVLDAAQNEMDSLLKTQEQLQKGSQQINQMMQEMENKQKEVDQSVEMLRTKNTELQSVLEYLNDQPDQIDVDEAVAATNPLYNQIMQLYAEENAIDDTIYYLGEALRKGTIELEVFLKHVRELSRQQFMARATIMKARSMAGLPPHGTVA